MQQSYLPEDVFMGREKSPCCSILRTSIWDEDQTEFHSMCFTIFPGGGGGEKKLKVLAMFQGHFHFMFTMNTLVVRLCYIFGVIWLDLFHCTWQFMLGFFFGGGGGCGFCFLLYFDCWSGYSVSFLLEKMFVVYDIG